MLRAPVRQRFLDVLERSYFGIDNFSVSFGDGKRELAKATFLPNSNFEFLIERTDSDGVVTTEAPGHKFLSSERFGAGSIEIALARLSNWTERVRDEIVATNPFAREIGALRADLDQRMSSLGQELGEFFSRSEAELLQKQLDRFAARLAELAGENSELRDALDAMNVTIGDLKGAAEVVNKGTWLRMSSGRLLSGLKSFAKSKEVREFALEAAKKVLLEGPK